MAKLSQKDQLLSYLHQYDDKGNPRSISALEAIGLFRIFRLAARINDLRDDGLDIKTSINTDVTGKIYARYSLA